MLHFLKIFSWFLLTFGVVGVLAAALDIDMGIGTGGAAMAVLALQALVGALIVWGFRQHDADRLKRKTLLYGGWTLVVIYIVVGQVLLGLSAT